MARFSLDQAQSHLSIGGESVLPIQMALLKGKGKGISERQSHAAGQRLQALTLAQFDCKQADIARIVGLSRGAISKITKKVKERRWNP